VDAAELVRRPYPSGLFARASPTLRRVLAGRAQSRPILAILTTPKNTIYECKAVGRLNSRPCSPPGSGYGPGPSLYRGVTKLLNADWSGY
jgi:hypothetical protein